MENKRGQEIAEIANGIGYYLVDIGAKFDEKKIKPLAEAIYNASYRKQREVVKEILDIISCFEVNNDLCEVKKAIAKEYGVEL